uniref:Uncharacterized protein n=1 Tax=Anguilla anguilla TaxID=7936 RepID=A0A0E9SA67_ANGAN
MRRRKLKRRLFCPLDSCTKGWCCFFLPLALCFSGAPTGRRDHPLCSHRLSTYYSR